MEEKTPYICGPLTELVPDEQVRVKKFYEKIGDLCQEVLGARGFVPHEHYDPIKHAGFTPSQVDEGERDRVCNKTSLLIVATPAPSWGGGIEVEMAYRSGVPIILLCQADKLEARQISRLLRGNPGIKETIVYKDEADGLAKLRVVLGA